MTNGVISAMNENLKTTLNSGKTELVITQVKDNIIRINAIDIKAVLQVIPQANNCIEIKVVEHKED
jgi:hypothetical protein